MSKPAKKPFSRAAKSDDRERLFVEAYLANGRNGAQAAIAAGYKASSAKRQAVKLLARPTVKAMLAARTQALAETLQVTAERNLLERARLAYYDIGRIAEADIQCPADIAKLPEDLRRVITGWKWDKEGRFIIELADKHAHLTALDKNLGLYDKDNQQKGEGMAKAIREFFASIYGDSNKLPIAGDS